MNQIDKKRSNSILNDINSRIWNNLESSSFQKIKHLIKDQLRKDTPLRPGNANKKTPSTSLHTPADFTQVFKNSLSSTSKLHQQLTKRRTLMPTNDYKAVLEYQAASQDRSDFVTDTKEAYFTPQNARRVSDKPTQNKMCDTDSSHVVIREHEHFQRWKEAHIAKFKKSNVKYTTQ